jgi:hypothetical protein
MLSPDGQWVWDGTQWQPIAHRETLFPSWQAITVDPVAAVPGPAAVQAPVRMAGPTPALTQPVPPGLAYPSFPAGQSMPQSVPLWRRGPKPTGMNMYFYLVAGVIGFVIILVVLNSISPLWLLLPGPKPGAAPAAAQPSPIPPVAHRSDFARADHFVSGVLPPTMDSLNQVLTPVTQSCRALTISCQDAISNAEPQVKSTLAVIDHNPVPLCIAAPAAKLRADIATISTALAAADKAYSDNQAAELTSAMSSYSRAASQLGADVKSLTTTMNIRCETQVTGP